MQQQIKEREVWSAWVRYEDRPDEGKYRPVLVIDVDGDKAVVMSVPFTSTELRDEYDIEVFDWTEIPLEVSDDDWDNITDLLMQYMGHYGIE